MPIQGVVDELVGLGQGVFNFNRELRDIPGKEVSNSGGRLVSVAGSLTRGELGRSGRRRGS